MTRPHASIGGHCGRNLLFLALLLAPALPAAAETTPLVYVGSILLPGVAGRIDHMDVDVQGNRLFVAALGNGSLEVVDIEGRRHLQRVAGLREPQGVRFMPEVARLFVANGRSGTVAAFAADSLAPRGSIDGLPEADNLRTDANGRLYVGYDGGLAMIDPGTAKVVRRLALAGHPESFQVEQDGTRIFANLPSTHEIAVLDRASEAQAHWPLRGVQANYPMALDGASHRLFVTTRRPAALLVFDTDAAREVARLPTCGDSDDLFYDGERRRVYVICGQGEVEVFREEAADRFVRVGRIETRVGARTGLFVPARGMLYVAAPARPDVPAAILMYRVD